MNRVLSRIVKTAFILALAVLVVNAVLTYRDVRALHANAHGIVHTREVIAELQRTLSILKDAETGERGYLLTEDDAYLEPYQNAVAALGKALDRLSTLTADNPHQQAHVDQLRGLSDQKMKELGCTVALVKRKGRDAALELLRHRSRDLMDEARVAVVAMEGEEQRLLVERSLAYQRTVEYTIASSVITTTIAVGLLLAVAVLTRRSVATSTAIDCEAPWKRRKPLAKVKRMRGKPVGGATKGRTAFVDSPSGVFVIITLAILGLCALLLIVSRF